MEPNHIRIIALISTSAIAVLMAYERKSWKSCLFGFISGIGLSSLLSEI